MYIYTKHITKIIILPLVILTMVLTSLVWITQILSFIKLIDKGITLKVFFKIIISILPHLLFMVMPIISVLSVIYVYTCLQNERQILILRSAGLSNYEISKPALIVATAITIISYYISVYLIPISYNNLRFNLQNFKENYISSIIEARTFNQLSKNITLYIDKKNSNYSMEGVILFDNNISKNRTIYFAKHGAISNLQNELAEFKLSNGVRYSYDNVGHLTKLHFDNIALDIISDPENISKRNKISQELFIHELLWPDQNLTLAKQTRFIIDGHFRIIWPLFNFIFVIISLSIFLNFPYNRRSNMRQYIYSFVPIILVSYFHFTLHSAAYKNINYIFICYVNIFICIVFSIWQNTRKKL